jgi:sugar O-acyltransferase (sialic acid O-acetyltransferase NeuD family)
MSRRIFILGAGGFGRELFAWLYESTSCRPDDHVAGFLDSNPDALGHRSDYGRIVGAPEDFRPAPEDYLVCAIGSPEAKLRLCRELQRKGAKFLSLIHRTAFVGASSRLGDGVVLCQGAVVTSNVALGSFVTLNVHASVGHDAIVGDGCTLSAHCDVTGRASLKEGVFLGSHATVLPGVRVGEYAVVGAASAAFRTVKPRTTVVGVPARVISERAANQSQK